MKLSGTKARIIACVLAVVLILAGVYLTFFKSRGFSKTTAAIVALRINMDSEGTSYYPTVEFRVDGQTYTGELDSASSSYRVGDKISVLYDPADPTVVHSADKFPIFFIAFGALLLVVVVVTTVREKKKK